MIQKFLVTGPEGSWPSPQRSSTEPCTELSHILTSYFWFTLLLFYYMCVHVTLTVHPIYHR